MEASPLLAGLIENKTQECIPSVAEQAGAVAESPT
jgi:hypothetical protein